MWGQGPGLAYNLQARSGSSLKDGSRSESRLKIGSRFGSSLQAWSRYSLKDCLSPAYKPGPALQPGPGPAEKPGSGLVLKLGLDLDPAYEPGLVLAEKPVQIQLKAGSVSRFCLPLWGVCPRS